jgi:poly(3-hydroxybutyrate) depolymerase
VFCIFSVVFLSGECLPSKYNPGGPRQEIVLHVEQTWAQEPHGYSRTAKVAIPATSAGQKVPVVFHFHGAGGHGNTHPFGTFLGDDAIIVAPDGYENTWNIYAEPSKADDVQFTLALIEKIADQIPAADMDNVNIAGTSNGAALTYQLLINTKADRPFRRALPMVSSLIGPQYHEDQFWTFTESAPDHQTNNFDVPVVPTFSEDFEYAHFHGTDDGTIRYDGQNPGPGFLAGAEVYAAQLTDFIWARAMGYTGPQLEDSAGVDVGMDGREAQEYRYLGGRVRHYKLIGETHGSAGPGHPVVQKIVRELVLGHGK